MCRRCPSCPFREKGLKQVRPLLEARALSEGTPICHSTGPAALPGHRLLDPEPRACRGARDLQLQVFHALGALEAPTDAAWQKLADELAATR